VIAIDEAQFLDASIVELVTALAAKGKRVILAGTDPISAASLSVRCPKLLAVAEIVDKLHAICVCCGQPAKPQSAAHRGQAGPLWTHRRSWSGARRATRRGCRHCHEVPRRDEDQVEMKQLTS